METSNCLILIVSRKNNTKFLFIISAGYKPDKHKEYTESSPAENFDFLSQLVIDWEAAAELPESLNVRQFTVRSGKNVDVSATTIFTDSKYF